MFWHFLVVIRDVFDKDKKNTTFASYDIDVHVMLLLIIVHSQGESQFYLKTLISKSYFTHLIQFFTFSILCITIKLL